jgi:hypothetical protein
VEFIFYFICMYLYLIFSKIQFMFCNFFKKAIQFLGETSTKLDTVINSKNTKMTKA